MEENLTTYKLRLHFFMLHIGIVKLIVFLTVAEWKTLFFILENSLMLDFLPQTCILYSGGGILVNCLACWSWCLLNTAVSLDTGFFEGHICLSERVLGRLAFNERINELVTGNLNGKWSFSIEHKNPSYSEDSNNHFLLSHSDLFCLWKRPCK